ncbi:MAG: hypothetical protein CMB99_01025 [Flavobacteriaceae bacterium]|nr:hypothetical protein [Flavobacteriaceae bacterium]
MGHSVADGGVQNRRYVAQVVAFSHGVLDDSGQSIPGANVKVKRLLGVFVGVRAGEEGGHGILAGRVHQRTPPLAQARGGGVVGHAASIRWNADSSTHA